MEETYKGVPIRKIEEAPYDNEQTIKSRNKCGTGRPNRVGTSPLRRSAFNTTTKPKDRPLQIRCCCCGNTKPAKSFDRREDGEDLQDICKKCKKKHSENIHLNDSWSKQGLL